jgi:hypothetical protein
VFVGVLASFLDGLSSYGGWEVDVVNNLRGLFVCPCILASATGVVVIWVHRVLGVVSQVGFGEVPWGYIVGALDAFAIVGHGVVVPFVIHISEELIELSFGLVESIFLVISKKRPSDSDILVSSMLVNKGMPLLSLIMLIISVKVCSLSR